jgi:fucose 4-O-acetylase-like acetyltransferase
MTSSTSQPRSASRPRVAFVYTIRGLALFWIVLDHAVHLAQFSHGIVAGPGKRSPFNVVDDITEGTRLPVLMFLAALFVERGLREGVPRFVSKRLRYLAWPWLIWTIATIVVLATATRLGSDLQPTEFGQLLSMWWMPQLQTWFLYDLIVFNAIVLALRSVDRRLVLAGAVLLFAASLWHVGAEMTLVGRGLRHYGRLFLFFWLGIMLSPWALSRLVDQHRLLLIGCVAAFLLLAVPPVLLDAARWQVTAIASALPALPVMLWLGPRLAATPLGAPLGWAGRASLLILCVHFVPAWAIVLAATRLGLGDVALVGVTAAAGALALCYGVDRLAQRTGAAPLLGFAQRGEPMAASASAATGLHQSA